jgi:hypothetical protein
MSMETQFSSVPQIIRAVEEMSAEDLDKLVRNVLEIQAARRAPLWQDEANLLRQINLNLPRPDRERVRELQNKRMAEELSQDEYAELAALTDKLEELHAQRLNAISKLSDVRGISLKEMMNQLGISLPDHD